MEGGEEAGGSDFGDVEEVTRPRAPRYLENHVQPRVNILGPGGLTEAEELLVQVVEKGKRILGQEHPDTLASMANLAMTYSKQGRWNEVEELYGQVIQMRTSVLGEEHPDTVTTIANLAMTYRKQGR